MLARVMLTYDIKLEDNATRPQSWHIGIHIVAHPTEKVHVSEESLLILSSVSALISTYTILGCILVQSYLMIELVTLMIIVRRPTAPR
ncbi:hypothetical protein BDN67DRAFT_963385 [Paxillus ammoniavirescens]|nr:hypothetical protein BDN67DRAFT_963385 [Paxillus ammoniavirescens]